jgi:hypothetical protein
VTHTQRTRRRDETFSLRENSKVCDNLGSICRARFHHPQSINMGDNDEIIRVYYSSVSSNRELKKKQERILNILSMKNIEHEKIDISAEQGMKERMRELCNDEKALPPRIFKGDKYLGDYDGFDEAVEGTCLNEFLQM